MAQEYDQAPRLFKATNKEGPGTLVWHQVRSQTQYLLFFYFDFLFLESQGKSMELKRNVRLWADLVQLVGEMECQGDDRRDEDNILDSR